MGRKKKKKPGEDCRSLLQALLVVSILIIFSLTKFLSWLSEMNLVLKVFYAAMIIRCPLAFAYIMFNAHKHPC